MINRIVLFKTDNCEVCDKAIESLQTLDNDDSNDYTIEVYDFAENQMAAAEMGVSETPSMLVEVDGKIMVRAHGHLALPSIKSMIRAVT